MVEINVLDFEQAIAQILQEYNDLVFEASEEGLDAAEKVLIKKIKAQSEKVLQKTSNNYPGRIKRNFAKGWKGKKKYKTKRYVGNNVIVDDIPLSNIIEYSSKGNPFIKKTFNESIPEMAKSYVDTVKGKV